MPKIIHHRVGAPFALIKDEALPFNINTAFGGVDTEVAVINDFQSAISGALDLPPVEPAAAKQACRYHFLTTQNGFGAGGTFTDFGPDAIAAYGAALDAINQSWTTVSYATHDGQVNGAYGASFYGGDAITNRIVTAPINKLMNATIFRMVMVVQPRQWTDRIEGVMFSIMTGNGTTTSSVVTSGLRQPSGALTLRANAIGNVFANDIPILVEVQYNGTRTQLFVNGVLVQTVNSATPLSFPTAPRISMGNATGGGRAFTGYISYAACYVGELTEQEIAWIRNEAKNVVAARPGGFQNLPTMPAPQPAGALKFSALPNTSPSTLQSAGQIVTLQPGRAVHGITGPIAVTHKVLFGPVAGEGTDITPPDLTVTPSGEGYLTYEMTADNGVHPSVTARKVLPVAVTYPTLNAAAIASRLGVLQDGIWIDDFDAGFPPDTVWRTSNVCDPGDGTVGLRIIKNAGTGRANTGASVQIRFTPHNGGTVGTAARIFRADFVMQLIDTRGAGQAKGYIQTGFTFTDPWTLRRRELDFEYNSRTGKMECTIHLEPNDGGGSVAQGIYVDVLPEAFTGQRKWTILANADRVEWFYEDQLLTRYIRGIGWDSSVQTFNPHNGTTPFTNGMTLLHPRDAGWHLNPQNVIIQQWMSDELAGWIGPNTVPISHPLLKFSNVDAIQFGPSNTALQAADWTATPGTGQVVVNVSAFRPAGLGFRPTHLEYSVDSGAWTRLPGFSGNQTITGLAAGSRAIRIRPVAESLATNPLVTSSNFTMNADPSDTKTVTVL